MAPHKSPSKGLSDGHLEIKLAAKNPVISRSVRSVPCCSSPHQRRRPKEPHGNRHKPPQSDRPHRCPMVVLNQLGKGTPGSERSRSGKCDKYFYVKLGLGNHISGSQSILCAPFASILPNPYCMQHLSQHRRPQAAEIVSNKPPKPRQTPPTGPHEEKWEEKESLQKTSRLRPRTKTSEPTRAGPPA